MLQKNIKESWWLAGLAQKYPTMGHINYIGITCSQSKLRLNVHHQVKQTDEEPLWVIHDQRIIRPLLRQVMDLVDMQLLQTTVHGEGPVSYVLVDPNQFTAKLYRKKDWDDPRSELHPHQIWLREEEGAGKDRKVRQRAFLATCAYLKPLELRKLYSLHDSAQYHFINLMLWCRPDGSYLHPEMALKDAIRHHKEVTKG